jgi:hypothetical protein
MIENFWQHFVIISCAHINICLDLKVVDDVEHRGFGFVLYVFIYFEAQ